MLLSDRLQFCSQRRSEPLFGVRHCSKETSNVRELAVTKISEIDAAKLEELWLKSSVSFDCNNDYLLFFQIMQHISVLKDAT
jgi:hypothetical protein